MTVLESLRNAYGGLIQMTDLLQRAMVDGRSDIATFEQNMSLDRVVRAVVSSVAPLAAELRVTLAVDITPKASSLPAASLGPVILNGLRNAVQACATSSGERRVELSIAISRFDQLMILIRDTGSGVVGPILAGGTSKPDGHGLGLELAKRLVAELGGDLRLTNIPFGGGAILQVVVPLQNLATHG